MPLPAPNAPWPPKNLAAAHNDIAIWSAWYGGSAEDLTRAYGGMWTGNNPTAQSWEQQTWTQRGGLAGGLRRFFWGQPYTPGQQNSKLHVPVAAEIAQVSADLLFGQPPTITYVDEQAVRAAAAAAKQPAPAAPSIVPAPQPSPAAPGAMPGTSPAPDAQPAVPAPQQAPTPKPVPKVDPKAKATQDRIEELLGEAAHTMLHEAAEACAGLGHTYLRVGWDLDVDPKNPLIFAVDADAAYPTYRYGRLTSVLFVREWDVNGATLRHLESHDVVDGRGMIWHGAYLGERDNLGHPVPLSAFPQTADVEVDGMIADEGINGAGIETGINRLDVVGVSNARSRTWRHLPGARDLGRADISGCEPLLDALDDCFTSWMRDLRHGRSRIHVPQYMLDTRGPGRGATFDLDKELYVGLNSPPDGDLQLTSTQFEIRVQQHADTAHALHERIVSGCGYSPQTFGLDEATAITATESWARQTRTQNTRAAKVRRWRQALIELSQIAIAIDVAHFGGKGDPELIPEVRFAESISESTLARAQTAQLLRAAEAASTATIVGMVHGDWDQDQIDVEVDAIGREQIAANPPPMPSPLEAYGALDGRARAEGGAPNSQPGPADDGS